MTEVLAAGPRALVDGEGRLLHAGGRALNLVFGDRVLTLLARDGLVGPSSVVLDLPALPRIERAHCDGEEFVSTPLSFHRSRVQDLRLPLAPALDPANGRTALAPWTRGAPGGLVGALAGAAPPAGRFERRVWEEVSDAVRTATSLEALVARMLGKGPGLTPAGDDFVVGLVATLQLLHRDAGGIAPIVHAYPNAFSRTLLEDALAGYFAPPLLQVLEALQAERPTSPSVARLTRSGHSSGWDTLAGLIYGFERFSR
jgi:hypothetical protein